MIAFSSVPNPFIAFLKISASFLGLKEATGTTVGVALSCEIIDKIKTSTSTVEIKTPIPQLDLTYNLRISIIFPITRLSMR